MAVTNEFSAQYLKATDPRTYGRLDPEDTPMNVRIERFEFTQSAAAGDATSTMTLGQLPPGRCVFFPKMSWLSWDAFGASRVLDIGHAAYTGEDGVAVVAATNKWDDNIDVSSAGGAAMGSDLVIADAAGTEFKSAAGVNIVANVAGGTIPAGTKIFGYLAYMPVGA